MTFEKAIYGVQCKCGSTGWEMCYRTFSSYAEARTWMWFQSEQDKGSRYRVVSSYDNGIRWRVCA